MVLHHLIDFCFDGGENKFIQINKFGAYVLVNNKRKMLYLIYFQTAILQLVLRFSVRL